MELRRTWHHGFMTPAAVSDEELAPTDTGIMVTSRDERMRPHVTRAESGASTRLPADSRWQSLFDGCVCPTIFGRTGRFRSCSHSPGDCEAMQIVGVVDSIDELGTEDFLRVDQRIDRFVADAMNVGTPPAVREIAGDRFACHVAPREYRVHSSAGNGATSDRMALASQMVV